MKGYIIITGRIPITVRAMRTGVERQIGGVDIASGLRLLPQGSRIPLDIHQQYLDTERTDRRSDGTDRSSSRSSRPGQQSGPMVAMMGRAMGSYDAEKYLKFAGAVNPGHLNDRIRNISGEIGTHHNNVESAHQQVGDKRGEYGVADMEGLGPHKV